MNSEVYQLQPLLYPALPLSQRINPTSPAAISLAVRCAESNGRNLYVGSSDGYVHHYVLMDQGSSENPNQFSLVSSKLISPSGKPVERLLILHRIGVAAVLAESTLTLLHLPNLDPLPPNTLPIVRGVTTVVLDDAEVQTDGTDGQGYVSLCVVKRRQVVLAKVGMARWVTIKEISVPPGIVLARRYGDTLCAASTTDYCLINLTTSVVTPLGLPISHSTESPSASTRPSIVSLPASNGDTASCEFLITSHSEEQTLGVFVTPSGEPAAKLLEFPSHPRALCVEWPNLVALLRNDSIEVYSLETMQNVQKVQLPDLLEPRLLSSGQSSLDISLASPVEKDFSERINLSSGRVADGDEPTSLYDFPAALKHTAWRDFVFLHSERRSKVLMTCKNAVQALCEPAPFLEMVPLICNERWASLEAAAERQWSDSELKASNGSALRHVYGLLSLRYLSALNFYGASIAFQRSSLDFRILLRIFPDLWHAAEGEQVSIFSALKPLTERWRCVEDMIAVNLEQNYGDDWQEDEIIRDLQTQLRQRAYDMMENVLESSRDRHAQVVDTPLAKLYAIMGDSNKLSSLLRSENSCDLESVEGPAKEMGATASLAELYYNRKKISQAVDLWTAMIDGDVQDPQSTRGVNDVIRALEECQDPDLQSKYALWVVKYDVQAGVKLLTQSSGKIDLPFSVQGGDHVSIINKLRQAGAKEAADQFIEQIVLSQSQAVSLHQDLIDTLLQCVEVGLQDEATRTILLDLTEEYVKGGYAEGFAGHLALHVSLSPVILHRLKLIMLLQGSNHYNATSLLARMEAISPTAEGISSLAYERAVLLGKLSRHEEALKLLALQLHDANSSEAYCSQGGIVLSPFMAKQIASSAGQAVLHQYAALVARGVKAKRVKGAVKDRLLMTLLKVYMENGSDDTFRTATSHLLNTQALRLSTLEILPLVPDHWPISTLSTFLKRNLRRESHRRHEGAIKRALALSQSLEVTEESWRKVRAMGGVIQDVEDEDIGGAGTGGIGWEGQGDESIHDQYAQVGTIAEQEMDKKGEKAIGRGGARQGAIQVIDLLPDKEIVVPRS